MPAPSFIHHSIQLGGLRMKRFHESLVRSALLMVQTHSQAANVPLSIIRYSLVV